MSKTPKDKDTARPRRRRRWLRWLGWGVLVYCALSVVVSFIPERPLEVQVLDDTDRTAVTGLLLAGTSRIEITPREALWDAMNLYGEDGPITGVHDAIYARALTLGVDGSEGVVSLVSVELLIIPPRLRDAVREQLAEHGHDDIHLMLAATHTHAGPGNFWDVPFGKYFMGRYNEAFVGDLVDAITAAVLESREAMVPARIAFGATRTRHLVKHRRYKDPVTDLPPPVDEELEVIRIDSRDGQSVLAYVLNFAAHPTTVMHRTDGAISGEFPGRISRKLEDAYDGAVALFLQGACGSVRSTSPRPYAGYADIAHERFAKVEMQADMLMTYVKEAEAEMTFADTVALSAAALRVALPGADAHFFPEERPWMTVRILTLIPNWVFNGVVDWWALPDETVFQAVRINHAYLLTFPGDLGNAVGWKLKRYLRRDHVLIVGQANDYALGYVPSREEYDMGGVRKGGSERGQCFFGKRAGPFCIEVARLLAETVKEPDADDVFRFGVGDFPSRMPDGSRLD